MKLGKSIRIASSVLGALIILTTLSCTQKPFGDETPFMKLGNKSYTTGEYLSFSTMQYNHPVLVRDGFFPGERHTSTVFVQSELVYDEAKAYASQVTRAADWDWKETYMLADFFQRNTMQENLGSTRAQMEEYFNANRGVFLFNSDGTDTAFTYHMTAIADSLFLQNYPPTEEFRQEFPTVADTILTQKWIAQIRPSSVMFLRDEYYNEAYGTAFPEDTDEFFGEDKFITPADLELVKQWLPEDKLREIESNLQTRNMIISYMAGWKLFANKAREIGIDKDGGYQQQMRYFERYELARYYLNTVLFDEYQVSRSDVNEDFATLAVFDHQGIQGETVDSMRLNTIIDEVVNTKTSAAILGHIHNLEVGANLEFLHPDYKYELEKSSEQLFFEAEDKIDEGKRDMAKAIYRKLIEHYPYSTEGLEAYRSLAALHAGNNAYGEAISSYRNYLLHSNEDVDWCNVMFMIGYTYSEQMSRYDLAAVNYKWILQNRPACDLVEDTEYMYLHLGEPMSDVEELRAESARQGRDLN